MGAKINIGELALDLRARVDQQGFRAGDKAIESTLAKIKRLAVAQQMAHLDAQKLGEQMGMLDRKSGSMRNLGNLARQTGEKLGSFSNMVMGGLVAAGVAATYTLAHWSEETFKLGGHIDDVSKKTGLNTDAIQEWRYGAKLGGADAEAFEKGTVRLARGLDALSTGKGPAVEALRTLGISLQDPAVKSKNLEKILYLVSNAASRMPDGLQKTAAFMKLFGKAGADLIPMFDEGVISIKAMNTELRKLGGVMNGSAIASLATMDDKVDKLKTAMEGLKNRAVIALLPHLQSLADRVLAWVEANQGVLGQKIPEFMERVWHIAEKIGEAFTMLAEHWRLVAGAIGVTTVIGTLANMAIAVVGVVKAVKELRAGWAAMSGSATAGVIGTLGAVGLLISSLAFLDSRLHAHDSRDTIQGKNSGDVTADEASQLRVERAAAPDVDSITIAKPLTEEEILARDRKLHPQQYTVSPEIKASLRAVQDSSPGARLTSFLQPSLSSGPAASSQGTSGAAGPGMASSAFSDAAGITSPNVFVSVPPSSGGSRSVTYSPSYSVQIDAKGMDPDQLGTVLDAKLREHDERSRRETHAALNGGV